MMISMFVRLNRKSSGYSYSYRRKRRSHKEAVEVTGMLDAFSAGVGLLILKKTSVDLEFNSDHKSRQLNDRFVTLEEYVKRFERKVDG